MCTAPSSSTTPKSNPCRPSEPIRPLRMVMLRGICAATSGSWVTSTTVVPNSALTTWISSSIASRSSWLSCEVGSSASSRPAPEETAEANATRCRSPPDMRLRAAGRPSSPMPSWSSSRPRLRQPPAGGRGDRLAGELDVLLRARVGQQVAAGALQQRRDRAGPQPARARTP